MTERSVLHIRRGCAWGTAAALAAAGLCLSIQCLRIYRTGAFTPELVRTYFSPIALPVWLSIFLSAAGLLAELFLPPQNDRPAPVRDPRMILSRLKSRRDLSAAEPAVAADLEASHLRCRRLALLRLCICGLWSIRFLSYALNFGNYHTSQINSSMIRAVAVLLPYLAAAFLLCLWIFFQVNRELEVQISLWKTLPALSSSNGQTQARGRNLWSVKTAILCCALVLMLYGWFTGGTEDVLTKAVNICTECVGLG